MRRKLRALPAELRQVEGRLHSIESCGTVDGPGIRTVVFLQGCLLQCRFCHNPDTWRLDAGQVVTVEELLLEVIPFTRYHSATGGGLTLSGGDPLAQPAFSAAVLSAAREIGIHTALDTAGGVPLERSEPVLDAADLVLLDLKHTDPERHRWLTAVPLANPIATGSYLASINKPVWMRVVIVPGETDSDAHIDAASHVMAGWPNIERVDVLGYHTMARDKWLELGKAYPLGDTPPADPALVRRVRERFQAAGLPVAGLDVDHRAAVQDPASNRSCS